MKNRFLYQIGVQFLCETYCTRIAHILDEFVCNHMTSNKIKNPVNQMITGFLVGFDTRKVESETIESIIFTYALIYSNCLLVWFYAYIC